MTENALLAAAGAIFRQGESLLRIVSDESYTRRLPEAFNSAVGGHYRHCLDHFQCLLEGLETGEVNYDHRHRDLRVEHDRDFALAETRRLLCAWEIMSPGALALPIMVRSSVSYDAAESPASSSTVGREVMYAIAHAIHHYALLAVMCGLLGVRLPPGFGVAPSTIRHQAEQQSAA
jgi:hypothetical protein